MVVLCLGLRAASLAVEDRKTGMDSSLIRQPLVVWGILEQAKMTMTTNDLFLPKAQQAKSA
jgi:hypothetical protein